MIAKIHMIGKKYSYIKCMRKETTNKYIVFKKSDYVVIKIDERELEGLNDRKSLETFYEREIDKQLRTCRRFSTLKEVNSYLNSL